MITQNELAQELAQNGFLPFATRDEKRYALKCAGVNVIEDIYLDAHTPEMAAEMILAAMESDYE